MRPRIRKWLLTLIAISLVAGFLMAVTLYLYFSSTSQIAGSIGQESDFGGPDTHLHLTVTSVERMEVWGETPDLISPQQGSFCLVTIRLRNSAAGRDFTIDPSHLEFRVVDQARRVYPPVRVVTPGSTGPVTALSDLIRGQGSYQRSLLFDLPDSILQPLLRIKETSRLEDWLPEELSRLLVREILIPLDRIS